MYPLQGLRNLNLNDAYLPQWEQPASAPHVIVPQGNTAFDPFQGTRWGQWLDAAGAGDPGGIKAKAGQSPADSQQLRGLRSALVTNPLSMPPVKS